MLRWETKRRLPIFKCRFSNFRVSGDQVDAQVIFSETKGKCQATILNALASVQMERE